MEQRQSLALVFAVALPLVAMVIFFATPVAFAGEEEVECQGPGGPYSVGGCMLCGPSGYYQKCKPNGTWSSCGLC